MSDSKQKNASMLKKAIWIILPIIIIAVVVVTVFAGQSNSLSDQIAQLEHDKADLSRKLNEADLAVRTAQELADTERNSLNEQLQAADARALEAETKAKEAETKVQAAAIQVQAAEAQAQEAADALTDMTSARDQLQAENTQIADGIRQVRSALSSLISDDPAAELQEAKDALAAMTGERDELQNTLAQVESERDELKNAVVAAAAQAAELQTAQEALAALTQERDGLKTAVENAKIENAKVLIADAEGNTVRELDDVNALDLASLAPGEYTVTVTVYNAAGESAAQYSFRHTAN